MDSAATVVALEESSQGCILCSKKNNLIESSDKSNEKLIKCANQRKLYHDTKWVESVEKVLQHQGVTMHYHRGCYQEFTNEYKINRLKAIAEKNNAAEPNPEPRVLRSTSGVTEKNLCIICLKTTMKDLRKAATISVIEKIEKISQYDYDIKRRVGCYDAVAAGVMYHTYCLQNKLRSINYGDTESTPPSNLALDKICYELRLAAARSQVLQSHVVFDRYRDLARDIGEVVPQKYESRTSSFLSDVESRVRDVYNLYRPMNRDKNERKTLFIPLKYSHELTVNAALSENLTMISYPPSDDGNFMTLVHAASLLRNELGSTPGHTGLNVKKEDAMTQIPPQLDLFLSVMLGGKNSLDQLDIILDKEDGTDKLDQDKNALQNTRILSLAQDMIFIASGGRKMTPKHIGLGLTLHMETRSKKLVMLLNKAGHCISYDQLLQFDTGLAEKCLESMDTITGSVVPSNLMTVAVDQPISDDSAAVLHVTADNVDIQLDTLDGKRSFHGTQMVVFHRYKTPVDKILESVRHSNKKSLKVPVAVQRIINSKVKLNTVEPQFDADLKWFENTVSSELQTARAKDLTFMLIRQNAENIQGWTEFNRNNTQRILEQSSVGYMPMILEPAHEMGTLNTVLQRSIYIADKIGHNYIVVTVDQQLYCRLLELKWDTPEYQRRVILRMGGLHISLNFLKVIGKHMSGSGLMELWIESGIVSENSADKVMDGRAYSKGMRLLKLTLQAVWRLLLPKFLEYLSTYKPDVSREILDLLADIKSLEQFLTDHCIFDLIQEWCSSVGNSEVKFWMTYVEMGQILLQFTRSIRDGMWELYLSSLSQMLPYIARYDHHNYLKSMSAYIAEMHSLPPEIEAAFKRGDFGVKIAEGKFNQVDPDHAQEWLVGDVKNTSSGIIGIAQDPSALQRWALTASWHAAIAVKTYEFFGLKQLSDLHTELNPGRAKRDAEDEKALLSIMESFNMFNPTSETCLRNVATQDLATEEIKVSLLSAKALGLFQVKKFVSERLTNNKSASFHAKIKMNKAPTFKDLYKTGRSKSVVAKTTNKENRSVLQRLIAAYEAGRAVNLREILKHELHAAPLAFFNPDGSLRGGNKSDLFRLLTETVECPQSLEAHEDAHLIIDAQALVMAIGKPKDANTFGDLASAVCSRIKALSVGYQRVDLVFDRYRPLSIKAATRQKRSSSARPIRKIVDSRTVPLPKSWKNFVALPENKVELSEFLSHEIIAFDFGSTKMVVAGGFAEETGVLASPPEGVDTSKLHATHEEADTRLVLHAVHSSHRRLVISARDTDVFLLMIHHYDKMEGKECFLMAGTSKDRKFVPIHTVVGTLTALERQNILAFHSGTGCDSNSFIAGIGKRGAWNVYRKHSELLNGIGVHPLSDSSMAEAEKFLVLLYKSTEMTCDDARHALFGNAQAPERLPPTSDAARQHIKRMHFQTAVWRNADQADPPLPDPIEYGYREVDGALVAVSTMLPSVPNECITLLSCNCKGRCGTRLCSCRRAKEVCTNMCKSCGSYCLNKKEEDGFLLI